MFHITILFADTITCFIIPTASLFDLISFDSFYVPSTIFQLYRAGFPGLIQY